MLFEVTHTTDYHYSDKVFFEPHLFRFKPKNSHRSVIRDFNIRIEPEPTGLSVQADAEDNHVILSWFDGIHDQMKISSHFSVEVDDYNPFDFLVYPPAFLELPFEYDQQTQQLLKPSLISEDIKKETLDFYQEILERSGRKSIDFLILLTREIHKSFRLIIREKGKPYHPDHTFDKKLGSCRDLAWMQIQMLRNLGMASRFVSGYFYVDAEDPEFELHAWVEVYLPGAGWIGLDPGHGMLTNAHHIPVAASAFHDHTMPVSGAIRGSATSKMKSKLNIQLTK